MTSARSTIRSPRWSVGGAIRDKYNALGAETGPLSYPTTDEIAATPEEMTYGQVKNNFIGGILYYDISSQRVRHGRWIDVLFDRVIEDDSQLPTTTYPPTDEPSFTPRVQTPCDPATTVHTGQAAADGWNCVHRFVDLGGTGVNVRKGTVATFGQAHYKRHWVEDRWVELFLQGNYPKIRNSPVKGTRGYYKREFFVGDEYDFEDRQLGFQVGVKFGAGHQVGVITAYCYLPNVSKEIPTCPVNMPPGLGFTRTVPLGE